MREKKKKFNPTFFTTCSESFAPPRASALSRHAAECLFWLGITRGEASGGFREGRGVRVVAQGAVGGRLEEASLRRLTHAHIFADK